MYGYQCGKETRTKMNMVHFPDRYLCLSNSFGMAWKDCGAADGQDAGEGLGAS